jgi:Na+-transporting NADH:ubiquinone oxidoreductase subunit NqrF
MPLTLIVKGLASGQTYKLIVQPEEKQLRLMNFLINHNFRIASSCSGEGVCKKCVVNKQIVSCQIKVEDFLKENDSVEIDYL